MTCHGPRTGIEPLIGSQHVSRTLVKRFMSFISSIKKSGKPIIIQLLDLIKRDTRTTTGFNLRTIMILTGKKSIEELEAGPSDFAYHPIDPNEAWRVKFIKEIINVKHGFSLAY